MNQISDIRPISDTEAARAVSPETLGDLAERITSTPVHHRPPSVRWAAQRPWRPGIALAAGLAVAVLVATTIGDAGTKVGPVNLGPASAQALSFTTQGRFIVVIVRNPLADPARYRAEFAAHHLNVKLQMVPVSPSLVGALVAFGGDSITQIKPITAVGKCYTDGGSNVCPVGVRIPTNYAGSADLVFGRAAQPGEQYVSGGPATAPGEVTHGLRFKGRTVATVLALLRARHVTVPQYRWQTGNYAKVLRPDQVPASWHVYNAIPWAPGQILLFVGPNPHSP